VVGLTATVETSNGVDTNCILPTEVLAALVDIKASDERISIESDLTLADLTAETFSDALSIVATLAVQHVNLSVGGSTALVRIASEARVTLTSVGHLVDTVTVVSTARGTDGWKDGRHTEEVPVTHETFSAETFVGVGVTGGVQTTGGRVAPLPALAGHAGERLRAGDGGGAGLGDTAASGERITQGSLTAGTGWSFRGDDALSVDPTDHPLTH
jgi:hypothetical protein